MTAPSTVRIVAVHSFRGGTGKSNLTANVATLLAARGRRVGVIDTDIQSPGIHVLFGLDGRQIGGTLNDHLFGLCEISEVAHEVTPAGLPGAVVLVPSSVKPGEITRVLREGYEPQRLAEGLRSLVYDLELDVLLIDTHPGLQEETLLSLVLADSVVVVLRADRQDFEGTGITIDVAAQLGVPRIMLVVNQVPPALVGSDVQREVEAAYGRPVVAVIHHDPDMLALASAGIFALVHPDHPLTRSYEGIAQLVLDSPGHSA